MDGCRSGGRAVRAAGVAGVVALALTGCVDLDGGGSDSEEDEAVEPDQDATTEDSEDEPAEDEAAEDEAAEDEAADDEAADDEPTETDPTETDPTETDPTETDTAEADGGGADGEVPEWYEVSADMWTTMESAESVDIDMTLPFSGEQHSDEEFRQDLDIDPGDDISQRIVGALDGRAVFEEKAGSSETTYLVQDEHLLVSGEDDLEASAEGLRAQGVDPDQFADDLAGRYVDYSEVVHAEISIDMFLTDVRSLTTSVGAGLEGEADERDGEAVWVYTDGTDELVVRADEDEPVLLEFTVALDDGTAEGTLSDWDSAEIPDEVDESDILTLDEAVEIYSR